MALGQLRYHELNVPEQVEPLQTCVRLATAGLFDDYVVYERGDEWCFAGGALAEVTLDPAQVSTRFDGNVLRRPHGGRPLDQVEAALADLPLPAWRAYGCVAFETAYLTGGLARLAGDAGALVHLMVPHTEVRIGARGAHVRSVSRATGVAVRDLLGQVLPASSVTPVDVGAADAAYQATVAAAVGEICAGRLQKVIVSRSVPVPFAVDFPATYLHGRQHNTPARSFLLSLGGRRAAGFSPETVAEVSADGWVLTQPLAGTRALGLGAAEDARLQAELRSDPKEVFEHAISVKVAHDELRTICVADSVQVGGFMDVKRRATVQHLGSTVSGRLGARHSAWDAFAALFPAVTASGIPKREAYECIARLEQDPRDLYGGAVLTVDSRGGLDAALVLRAVLESGGPPRLRAGAGIVAMSQPQREFDETCEKLASVAHHVVAASAPAPVLRAAGARDGSGRRVTRVVVTGIGVVAPSGVGVETFWRNNVAGRSYTRYEPAMAEMGLSSHVVARLDGFRIEDHHPAQRAAELRELSRFVQFGMTAGALAATAAGLPDARVDADRAGVIFSSAIGGTPEFQEAYEELSDHGRSELRALPDDSRFYDSVFLNYTPARIARDYDLQGPCTSLTTGCTAGIDALCLGFDLLREGELDLVVVGAAEAP